jgi:hypothetical protein
MLNLLKNLHDRAEEIRGPKLFALLGALFFVFLAIGISSNYFIDKFLKSNELSNINNTNDENGEENLVAYEGIITFVDPRANPMDDISYFLATPQGQQVILLKASDQKLEVSEGLFATVYGNLQKTADGKSDILFVEKVAINTR